MPSARAVPWVTLSLLAAAVLALAGFRHLGRTRRQPPARIEDAVLRIATRQIPNTLDWNRSSDSNGPNYPVARATMRGLMKWGDRQDLQLDAAAALELDDPRRPTVYTFRLRDDVRWSDGAPLCAQDFVFGWRRALDGFESKYFSDIVGVSELLALHRRPGVTPEERDAALARVAIRALDARTLEVRLVGPRSYFTGYLAGVYAFYPAPAHALAGLSEDAVRAWYRQPDPRHPLALGPYRVAAWNRLDQSMVLLRNPTFPAIPDQLPEILLFPSELAPVLYQQGRVDVQLLDDGPSTFQHPGDREVAPLWSTFWLGLNSRLLPLEVRRAIAMALDRPALGRGLLPRFRVAAQQLPAGFPGRLPDDDPRLRTLPSLDRAAARRLVRAAGWEGREITLAFRQGDTFLPEAALAEAVRNQLAEIGLRIQPKGSASLADELRGPDRRTRHGLFFRRTGSDFPHPQEFLMGFRYGGDPDQDNGSFTEFELGGASEPYRRFERAALATAATSDPGEQMAAAWEAQRILLAEQVVSVPLFYPDRYLRKRAWFRGFSIDPFNFLDFTRLQFIPPEARP